MNRIFWRHAQAGFGVNDIYRSLTPIGFHQAEDSAAQLKEIAKDFTVITSQCLRAKQTAEYYASPSCALEELNPDQPWQFALAGIQTITDENAIIVGHMPWISIVIAHFLNTTPVPMDNSEWWWLKFDEEQYIWKLYAKFVCRNYTMSNIISQANAVKPVLDLKLN